jgi:type III secretion protein L
MKFMDRPSSEKVLRPSSMTSYRRPGGDAAGQINQHIKTQKPAGAVIRAEDLPFWQSGTSCLDAAKVALEKVHQDIPRIVAEERAKAREAGWDAGKKEAIEWMAQMKVRAQSHHERLNKDIAELVIQIVAEIVGEMKPSQAVSSAVLNALKTIDLGDVFNLYVAPDAFDDVREKLGSALDPATQSKLALRQDPKLPPTSCRLVSEFGVVDLSIEKQLAILASSLRTAGVGLEL